ncbi:MAG: carboxypeptidase-like regulatory domain-containing protein [Bacteroidales bacterium]
MFKQAIILLGLGLLINPVMNAQQLNGRVFETENGKHIPIPGANVIWLGTNRGTTTNSNGEFLLNHHPDTDYLLVSFVGYRSDTVHVEKDMETIEIELISGEILDEIDVSERKTGSSLDRMETIHVENIAGEELHKAACCNLSQSFETNASVDATYSDAATGAKQIRLLGLSGRYVQLMTENFPNYYGLATPFGLEYIPGP